MKQDFSMNALLKKQMTKTFGSRVNEEAKKEFTESSSDTFRTNEFSAFSEHPDSFYSEKAQNVQVTYKTESIIRNLAK